MNAEQQIKYFRRNLLKDLLSQCTVVNIEVFNRMYGSTDEIPDGKIDWALKQVENTIRKNTEASTSQEKL